MAKGSVGEVVRLRDVWKKYAFGETEVCALSGLNMAVRKGEFVVILGASGSGKSTAMNMIGALDIPSEGSLVFESEELAGLRDDELAKIRGKKVGFVFQSFNLIPTLSALENVMLPMTFQGVSRGDAKKRALGLLRDVGLGERSEHRPTQLSGGEQQRVAIARALVNDPEIILADEPTGNLDSKTSLEIMKLLEGLNREGKTVILITHEKELARFASRVVVLRDGKVEKEVAGGKI